MFFINYLFIFNSYQLFDFYIRQNKKNKSLENINF